MASGQTRIVGAIVPKKSAVSGKIPTGTTLGEIFSNLSDKKLWGYDGSNVFEYGSSSFLGLTGGTVTGDTRVSNNLSAGTIYSGSTNLYDIFLTTNDGNDITRVQPGSNITTGGTANAPSVSVVASPSFNALTLSGSGQFAGATATSLSATTLSGGTILSGGTNLYNIFSQTDTVTRVQPGANTTTGGTANAPSLSVVASPSFNSLTLSGSGQFSVVTATSLSATTLSGGTILSGGTNLYNIFSQTDTVTRVQPGSNVTTGGTANAPSVSVVASPSFNSLTLSGSGQFAVVTATSLSATTLSGGTILSGGTNLYNIFQKIGDVDGVANVNAGSNIITGGTATSPTISVTASPSVNNITFSGTAIGGAVQAGAGTLTSLSAATLSGGTILSGGTNLYNIFLTAAQLSGTSVSAGSNIGVVLTGSDYKVSTVASPSFNGLTLSGAGQFAASTATSLSATTLSGGTILSGGTNLYSVFQPVGANTVTSAGSNITTGGTFYNQTVSVVASPSLNGLTLSGAGQFAAVTATSLSATTLSGGTILSGGTNLYNIFLTAAQLSGTSVSAGSNIGVVLTGSDYKVSTVASPSFNALTLSGSGQFAASTATSLSATTLSGGTILSGGTNLYNIFAQPGLVVNNINAGSNITTGGTATSPIINLNASPSFNALTISGSGQFAGVTAISLSATTLSGGTILSGGTNLYNIFSQTDTVTRVQPGANTTTGGTANAPSLSVVASPSFNSLTLSGSGQFAGVTATSLSATTLSGGTILSGGTNLYSIFQPVGANTVTSAGSNVTTGGTFYNQTVSVVASPSFNALTLSGSGQFAGATATSLSATTLSGGTILSGGTNLYNIFSQTDTVTRVQPGANTTTGGTANAPSVSVVASPSFDNLTFSGEAIGNALSASSISGYTIFLKDMDSAPATPTTGATMFIKDKANRKMTAQVGPSGLDYTFQPALYGNKIALWNPPGNSTTVPGVLGIAALRATGTATARNVAATNLFTRTKRIGVVSNVPAGSLAGYRNTVAQYTIGDGSGAGGFMFVIRFGVADSKTATRMFVGMRNSTGAPSNVEPSTITNCIGVGNGAANSNLFIYYGGSAAQTPINLGANFPCNTNSTDVYELTIFSSPNSNNTIGYRVERLNTGDIAQGVITGTAGTQIPSSSTLLTLNTFRTNNASAGAVAIDYISIYLETDN